MAVKIRLARAGAKKKPFYRVVIADSRSPRDGRFIEIVGRYNPRSNPSMVELDLERIKDWISKGAEPSETVTKLMAIAEAPGTAPTTAKDSRPSKKQAAEAAKPAADEAPAAPEPVEDEVADDATAADEADAPADGEPVEAEAEAAEPASEEPAEPDAPAESEE